MKTLLGLSLIVLLCRCSQKHPVISTEPLFLESPSSGGDGEEGEETSPPLRQENRKDLDTDYRKIHRLWNEDKNEGALALVRHALDSPSFEDKTKTLKTAYRQLVFQIAFDLQDLEIVQKAFEALDPLLDCSEQKFKNRLSLALLFHAQQKTPMAEEVLSNEPCKGSLSHHESQQRNYWLYRLAKKTKSQEKEKLKTLESASPVPHFYTYMASLIEKKPVGEWKKRKAFPKKIKVAPEILEDLQNAEIALREKKRIDSLKSLKKVKKKLQAQPTEALIPQEESLLYLSRLYQANGVHLEAMKVLNQLLSLQPTPLTQSEWLETFHRPFEEDITSLCDRWGVDPDLVYSLIRQESAFNPGAHSVAGARGLVQLMPVLAKFILDQWRVPVPKQKNYLFHVKANLPISIYHLHQLQQVFSHPALVAAAYNAGVQRVSQWVRRFGHLPLDLFTEFVPVKETRDYIKYVMRNLWVYKNIKKSSLYTQSHQSAGRGDELCLSPLDVLTGETCIP